MKAKVKVMNKMKSKVCGALCFLAFVFLLFSLAQDGAETHAQSEDHMDIRGKITNIRRASAEGGNEKMLGTILIEGVKEADTNFDKARLRVTNETRIFDHRGKERKQASFDDLKKGQKVEARFNGPVMESYPVQTTAGEIVILK